MSDKKDEKQHDSSIQEDDAAISSGVEESGASANRTREPFMDEYDEDLLNLSPPPPSPRFLVFTLAVLVLSVTMLFWFIPELKFFMSHFQEPIALGEAADIDVSKLSSGRYATVKGFPMVQRTLTFKEGIKWFMMSDNMRKFFPLAGRPNFYVQWEESDAHKIYRDPANNPGVAPPPSEFKGHLMSRMDLGKNYAAVFVFYDCLKYHYLGRCNRCLGKTDYSACRDTFVCRENNDADTCEMLLSSTEPSIKSKLESLRESGGADLEIRKTEAMLNAKREHRVAVQSVKLEEMAQRAERLSALAEKNPLGLTDETQASLVKNLTETASTLYSWRIEELKIRAANAFRTVGALSKAKRNEIGQAIERLAAKRKEKEKLTDELKIMRIFVNIGDELERMRKRAAMLKKKVVLLPLEKMARLASFNPMTIEGKELIDVIGALEFEVAKVERVRWRAMLKELGDAGVPRESGGDAGVADTPSPLPLPSVSAELSADARYQKLIANLDGVISRVNALLDHIKVLMPGQISAFDEWAKKPDVLGTIPEGLRELRVIGALGKLETMLAETPVSTDETPLLAEAYNAKIDALSEVNELISRLEKKPGLEEVVLTNRLMALAPSTDNLESGKKLESLLAELVDAGLYLFKLKGAPDAMAKLDMLLAESKLEPIEATLKKAEDELNVHDWVLIDGEIPLDKIWVIVVYLVLFSMIIVNLRKLWRFFIAYKE